MEKKTTNIDTIENTLKDVVFLLQKKQSPETKLILESIRDCHKKVLLDDDERLPF